MTQNRPSVVSEADAAKAVGLSLRTIQRLRQDGGGPPYVQLTERRIGYTDDALSSWLHSRTVASTSAATVAKRARGR